MTERETTSTPLTSSSTVPREGTVTDTAPMRSPVTRRPLPAVVAAAALRYRPSRLPRLRVRPRSTWRRSTTVVASVDQNGGGHFGDKRAARHRRSGVSTAASSTSCSRNDRCQSIRKTAVAAAAAAAAAWRAAAMSGVDQNRGHGGKHEDPRRRGVVSTVSSTSGGGNGRCQQTQKTAAAAAAVRAATMFDVDQNHGNFGKHDVPRRRGVVSTLSSTSGGRHGRCQQTRKIAAAAAAAAGRTPTMSFVTPRRPIRATGSGGRGSSRSRDATKWNRVASTLAVAPTAASASRHHRHCCLPVDDGSDGWCSGWRPHSVTTKFNAPIRTRPAGHRTDRPTPSFSSIHLSAARFSAARCIPIGSTSSSSSTRLLASTANTSSANKYSFKRPVSANRHLSSTTCSPKPFSFSSMKSAASDSYCDSLKRCRHASSSSSTASSVSGRGVDAPSSSRLYDGAVSAVDDGRCDDRAAAAVVGPVAAPRSRRRDEPTKIPAVGQSRSAESRSSTDAPKRRPTADGEDEDNAFTTVTSATAADAADPRRRDFQSQTGLLEVTTTASENEDPNSPVAHAIVEFPAAADDIVSVASADVVSDEERSQSDDNMLPVLPEVGMFRPESISSRSSTSSDGDPFSSTDCNKSGVSPAALLAARRLYFGGLRPANFVLPLTTTTTNGVDGGPSWPLLEPEITPLFLDDDDDELVRNNRRLIGALAEVSSEERRPVDDDVVRGCADEPASSSGTGDDIGTTMTTSSPRPSTNSPKSSTAAVCGRNVETVTTSCAVSFDGEDICHIENAVSNRRSDEVAAEPVVVRSCSSASSSTWSVLDHDAGDIVTADLDRTSAGINDVISLIDDDEVNVVTRAAHVVSRMLASAVDEVDRQLDEMASLSADVGRVGRQIVVLSSSSTVVECADDVAPIARLVDDGNRFVREMAELADSLRQCLFVTDSDEKLSGGKETELDHQDVSSAAAAAPVVRTASDQPASSAYNYCPSASPRSSSGAPSSTWLQRRCGVVGDVTTSSLRSEEELWMYVSTDEASNDEVFDADSTSALDDISRFDANEETNDSYFLLSNQSTVRHDVTTTTPDAVSVTSIYASINHVCNEHDQTGSHATVVVTSLDDAVTSSDDTVSGTIAVASINHVRRSETSPTPLHSPVVTILHDVATNSDDALSGTTVASSIGHISCQHTTLSPHAPVGDELNDVATTNDDEVWSGTGVDESIDLVDGITPCSTPPRTSLVDKPLVVTSATDDSLSGIRIDASINHVCSHDGRTSSHATVVNSPQDVAIMSDDAVSGTTVETSINHVGGIKPCSSTSPRGPVGKRKLHGVPAATDDDADLSGTSIDASINHVASFSSRTSPPSVVVVDGPLIGIVADDEHPRRSFWSTSPRRLSSPRRRLPATHGTLMMSASLTTLVTDCSVDMATVVTNEAPGRSDVSTHAGPSDDKPLTPTCRVLGACGSVAASQPYDGRDAAHSNSFHSGQIVTSSADPPQSSPEMGGATSMTSSPGGDGSRCERPAKTTTTIEVRRRGRYRTPRVTMTEIDGVTYVEIHV